MPHIPEHILDFDEALRRLRERNRKALEAREVREAALIPAPTPPSEVPLPAPDILPPSGVPPGTPSIGPPASGDDFENRLAPRPTSRERLMEDLRDLVTPPERGSFFDSSPGQVLEFLGDAAQIGILPLDAFGEAVAQAAGPPGGPTGFLDRAFAFQDRPVGEQIAFGLIDPALPLGLGRAIGSTTRNLFRGSRFSGLAPASRVTPGAPTAQQPLAQLVEAEASTRASSPESRLLALRESQVTPQELSSLEQSVVAERLAALRESKGLEQTALPAPSEAVPPTDVSPPQIGAGQVARVEELVPEGIVDEIPSVQPEITAGPGEDTITKFQRFLNDRARVSELDVATTARTVERARRFGNMENRVNELVEAGVPTEDAINLATRELSGPLPGRGEAIEEFSAPELRNELFQEVFDKLKGQGAELTSTARDLRNALAGNVIPRKAGTEGGSAFTRLQRVFGEDLTEALAQPGTLEDIIRRDVQDRNLGLTGFQGGARGDPGFPSTQEFGDASIFGQLEGPGRTQGRGEQIFGQPGERLFPDEAPELLGTPETPQRLQPPAEPFMERAVVQSIEESRLDVAAWRALQPSGAGSQLPPVNRPPGTPNLGDLPPDDLQAIQQLTLLTGKDKSKMLEWAKLIGVNTVDLGNLLRANLASVDMSYLRQQKKMTVSHPIAFAQSFKDALRALWSQEYADNLMRQIFSETDMPVDVFNPVGQIRLYDELNLQFLRPDWNVAPAGRREESLIILGEKGSKSRPFAWMAQHSPWINISGRAFVAGTNSMNWRIWKGNLRMLQRIQDGIQSGQIVPRKGISGQLPGNVPEGHSLEQSARSYGHMLEEMTGRARLGPLEKLSPALNAGFFSIRQRLGLLLSPRHLFNPDKFVRQEAWRNFMSAIATGSATVLAGERMGLWDVETDPRSSDYMKIKLFGGRVRIDIWGGNQQYFVLYARLLSALATGGQEGFKSTKTGKVGRLDPVQTLTQFARVGASPGVTTGITAGFGKDFGGRDIDRGDWKFWLKQNLALSIQDIREAYEAEGLLEAAVVTPLAVLGEGIQAHELSLQDVALQMEFTINGEIVTGIDYDDLPEAQREIVRDRLKVLRSPREREEFERKAEETKTRSKEREEERRRNFSQGGGQDRQVPGRAPQQPVLDFDEALRRLRERQLQPAQ